MCSCEQLLELRAATSDIAVVLDELGAELDKVRSPLRHLPRARLLRIRMGYSLLLSALCEMGTNRYCQYTAPKVRKTHLAIFYVETKGSAVRSSCAQRRFQQTHKGPTSMLYAASCCTVVLPVGHVVCHMSCCMPRAAAGRNACEGCAR